ncbi:MAG: hypothetical protein IT580_17495, partial [Verrucomicrobiales bacterium]|nr:hypothetical protein [Verrucomicrobiales bacterium]
MPLIRPLIPLLCAAFVLLQSVPSLGAQPKTRAGFSYGQQVVAAVLMAEAWGEGEVAMTAVAEVIRLRSVRAGVSP